jgi:DNA-directed RNA polymerase subunit RPC12/RpoP
MKCSHCKEEFFDNEIQESHDVPCYLFEGISRNVRKNQADKYGRRWLCAKCHQDYESALRNILQTTAIGFSNQYFGGAK